ncbi:MAG: MBL fold metallo-hydrolase [Anaerolineales bacterium]|nr:MBL fold metallo-hydrolase [Anaerolineales bacterium]
MHEIKPGIFYEDTYPGPTIGAILLPRGMIFIDAPLRPEDGHRWKTTLLNRSQGTIHKIVVCLDDHPDRTIGAKNLDCPVLTHKDSATSLSEPTTTYRGHVPESGALWERYPETSGMQWMIPDITFSEKMQFHWSDDAIILEHHPGPRPGSSWVIIPSEKVVFVGDAVVLKSPPFLDKAHLPTWIETLDYLLRAKFRDYTIISGRGGPVTLDDIRELKKTFRKIHRRIDKLASRRASAEDIRGQAEKFMDEFTFQKRDKEFFLQRLQHGLSQYYLRNYFPQIDDPGK